MSRDARQRRKPTLVPDLAGNPRLRRDESSARQARVPAPRRRIYAFWWAAWPDRHECPRDAVIRDRTCGTPNLARVGTHNGDAISGGGGLAQGWVQVHPAWIAAPFQTGSPTCTIEPGDPFGNVASSIPVVTVIDHGPSVAPAATTNWAVSVLSCCCGRPSPADRRNACPTRSQHQDEILPYVVTHPKYPDTKFAPRLTFPSAAAW